MSYDDLVAPKPGDPLAQRFRVNFRKARAIFDLAPGVGEGAVGWLLQDLDRGWWGIFALPRGMADVYSEVTISETPIAVVQDLP